MCKTGDNNQISPEMIAQGRLYLAMGLDNIIKKYSGQELIYVASYWMYLNVLVRIDMCKPIYAAVSDYIKEKRLNKERLLSKFDGIPYVSIKEFFKYMCSIDDLSVRDVIDDMNELGATLKEQLYDAIISKNYESFNSVVNNANYDFSRSAKLAKSISIVKNTMTTYHQKTQQMTIDKWPEYVEYLKYKFPNIERILSIPIKNLDESALNIHISFNKWYAGCLRRQLDGCLSLLPDYKRQLVFSKIPPQTFKAYQNIEIPEDCALVDSIVTKGDTQNWVVKLEDLIKEYDRDIQGNNAVSDNHQVEEIATDRPLYPDSKYGFIPEDYFDGKKDTSHPDDHLELVNEITKKGTGSFVNFINYIAKEGYINNDNATKALFAYRLSGFMRPDNACLKTIHWNGMGNSPYELLYIIRFFNKTKGKKYNKMKVFFEGPQWSLSDKNISADADRADSDFRQVLHGMYETCSLKYNQVRKNS